MKLTHSIEISTEKGNTYEANRVNAVEITKSINSISDVATVKLPPRANNTVWALPKEVTYGGKISISLGYDGDNVREFEGFITHIKTGKDIEILCEDSAFLLRKDVKSKEYKNMTVADILKDVIGQVKGVKIEVSPKLSPFKYDKFTVKDATAYEVLDKIKEEFKIHIYCRKNTVYAALKYELKAGVVDLDFDKNVEQVALNWEEEKYRKVLVEVVGIDKKNSKVSVTAGEKGGDKIKINRYNVKDEKTLLGIAEEERKKWLITGYKGYVMTWLRPYVSYGYTATVIDGDYKKRHGKYHVDAVTTTYGSRGGKRKITIGQKVA